MSAFEWEHRSRGGWKASTPDGVIIVRQRTLRTGFSVWEAEFPDGKHHRTSTAEKAKQYAEDRARKLNE